MKNYLYSFLHIFKGEFFFSISANQKQELHMAIMLLSNRDEMRKSHRMPSIDASCKFSSRLDKKYDRHGQFFFFDWLKFKKKIFSSKTRKHNVGMMYMYGRSCTKFPYFVPIAQLIWPSYAVLFWDWQKKTLL